MKKFLIASLVLFTSYLSACDCYPEIGTLERIIPVEELTADELDAIFSGEHSEIAIEFPENLNIPLDLFLTGNFLNLFKMDGPFPKIEIQRTFYVRFTDENLFLSLDSVEWRSVEDFVSGEASVSLTVENGEPTLRMGAETNLDL